MSKGINLPFDKAKEESIINVAYELIELVEKHSVENGVTQDHILAIFCLEHSILYKGKGHLLMEAWVNTGYQYAESANVITGTFTNNSKILC